MSFTVVFGWWLAPFAITAAMLIWAVLTSDHRPSSGYGNIGKGLGNALIAACAVIVSLVAWLMWAVLA